MSSHASIEAGPVPPGCPTGKVVRRTFEPPSIELVGAVGSETIATFWAPLSIFQEPTAPQL